MKRLAGVMDGINGPVKEEDMPNIDLAMMAQFKKKIVNKINSISPYYQMYLGRDRTVPLKDSVLNPSAPQSK